MAQALVVDDATAVHMMKSSAAKTFLEYAEQVFYPYSENKLQNVSSVDIVSDQYLPDSLI